MASTPTLSGSLQTAEVRRVEQRQAPRRSLYSTVQYAELRTPGPSKARISDISVGGCYVDTLNPLPIGTEIRLKLRYRGAILDVRAVVVRIEPNMGMGIKFLELTDGQRALIDKWMSE